jgi:cytochrome c-type biogenesis protein CcmH/NrfF
MKKQSAISLQPSATAGNAISEGHGFSRAVKAIFNNCHPERTSVREGSALSSHARKTWAVIGLLTMLLLTMAPTDAQHARFNDLGHKMMCTCGCNQVLLECNHVGCTASDKMRGELQESLDKGLKDQDVLDTFVQKYGATVLNAPTTHGFNLVAWIMPFATLLLATWFTVVFIRKWKGRPEEPAGVAVAAAELRGADIEALRRQAREETEV